MKSYRLFILLFLMPILVSCGPIYDTQYKYSAPPTSAGKACAVGCLDTMSACKVKCEINQAECEKQKTLEMDRDYLGYLEGQKSKGEVATKDRSDFESSRSCSISVCIMECGETHRICYSTCGGDVIQTRICTAFCD